MRPLCIPAGLLSRYTRKSPRKHQRDPELPNLKILRYTLCIALLLGTSIQGSDALIVYVGPSEESKTIANAMWKVSDYDTIIVRDGVYPESIIIRSPLTLMSENRHGAVIGNGQGDKGNFQIRDGPVTIEGFLFDSLPNRPAIIVGGRNAETRTWDCVIRHNKMQGRKHGVFVSEFSTSCRIDSNIITACTMPGIIHNGAGNNIIAYNRIENCEGSGILLTPSSEGYMLIHADTLDRNNPHGIEIHRNYVNIEGNVIKESGECGIRLNPDAQGITISDGNHISFCGEYGIRIETRCTASIIGNELRHNGIEHIFMFRDANATIKGNTLTEGGETAIRLQGTANIDSNIISNNYGFGIVNEGHATITRNDIFGNHQTGIEIAPESIHAYLEDNYIYSNGLHGVQVNRDAELRGNTLEGNNMFGIAVDHQAYAEIKGSNEIVANMQHGILIERNASARITGNTISGNGAAGIPETDFSGIFVSGSATIDSNRIDSNAYAGILVMDSARDVHIIHNPSICNSIEGVVLQGPARVEGNIIHGNESRGIWVGRVSHTLLKTDTIYGNRVGIFVHPDARDVIALNCSISNNLRGIVSFGELTVRRNTIENNTETGIRIRGAGIDLGKAAEEEAGQNQIRDNGEYNIYHTLPDTIYACRNFWGTPDTSAIDSTIHDNDEDSNLGPVIFTPVLGQDATHTDPLPTVHGPPTARIERIWPNPFRGELKIRIHLEKASCADLVIYDLGGRKVYSLLQSSHLVPGSYDLDWNGRGMNGSDLPAGFYIAVLDAGIVSSSRIIQKLR